MYMNNSAVRGLLKAIVIVGLLFMVVYYLSYNKWLKHDFDSVDITYRVDDTPEKEKTSDNTKIKELYSNVNYELLQYNFGEDFYDVYYNNKPFYDEYFIYFGIINIIRNDIIVNCNLEKSITSQELKKEIDSIFGSVKYTNKSFTDKNNKINIDYDSDKDIYNVKLNGTCSGFDYSNGGIKSIYKNYEIKDNYLYIYEKASYVESIKDKNGNIKYNYHKDVNKKSEVIANNFDKVDINILPTYVYKFASENNEYKLKSITKVS